MQLNSKKAKSMLMILGFMAFFANGDNYAVAPLIVDIASDLQIPVNSAALSVTSYMLSFGLFTVLFGPLGDRYGKTKIIKIAAFGTAIFSSLGAVAFNLESLIVLRTINGAFAAGIFPVTMALIGDSFSDKDRQFAIAKVMGMMFFGGASATVLGGALAYFGSWRLVYLAYGLAEFVIALVMIKKLEDSKSTIDNLNFKKVYGQALSNVDMLLVIGIIFVIGYTVFGSFTYSGDYIQQITGYNIFYVGIILSFFGLGTVIGGKNAAKLRNKFHDKFLISAGILGVVSLYTLSQVSNPFLLMLSLFGFGWSFVSLQSTLVTYAQAVLPELRGTAMSLASLAMFVGGGVGTFMNGYIIDAWTMTAVFIIAAVLKISIGIFAHHKIEMSKLRS
ncbi:MAG: major facilitator superfamily transporter [Halanaerobium sp. T82-1]|jgi:predicted MFS family arabinose efflux permease|nr:MAG: major facilitator superfamily transporter [Halanaerobium sp. T82-1]